MWLFNDLWRHFWILDHSLMHSPTHRAISRAWSASAAQPKSYEEIVLHYVACRWLLMYVKVVFTPTVCFSLNQMMICEPVLFSPPVSFHTEKNSNQQRKSLQLTWENLLQSLFSCMWGWSKTVNTGETREIHWHPTMQSTLGYGSRFPQTWGWRRGCLVVGQEWGQIMFPQQTNSCRFCLGPNPGHLL